MAADRGSARMWLMAALLPVLALRPSHAGLPMPAAAIAGADRADSYYLYCLSQQALLRRDFGQALRYLEESSRSDPNEPILALELARAYLNLNESGRAIEEASRAAGLDPNAAEPKRLIADAYRLVLAHEDVVTEDLFGRAVAAHIELLAVDPTDADARLSLSRLYLSRGLFRQAAEILKVQVASQPASAEARFLLSQALLRSGSASEAKEVLETALEQHPGESDLLRSLAEAMEAQGDLDGAARTLETLAGGPEGRPAIRLSLGRLYHRMKKHDSAAAQAALVLDALNGAAAGSAEAGEIRAAYLLQVEAWAAAGRLDQALAASLRAEKDFPREQRFPLKRAELLLTAGREPEAEAVLSALASRPGDSAVSSADISEVFLRAGARKERQGDYESAAAFLRRSIETDPGNHAAMNYLGYMLAERGMDLAKAIELIQKAVSLDSENGAYLDSLGWAFFRLGRHGQAEDPLRRAARLIPEEPLVHEHLGDLYEALGRLEDAVRAWTEAIRLGAGNADTLREKIRKAVPATPAAP